MAYGKAQSAGKGIPTPHDLVFKQFLTHPETARDFMQLHLPAELQAVCDFSTLKLESGSFVGDDLRPYFSDVLYSLKTKTGGRGHIYILIEQQSAPDRHMAFRLLRYALAAMQRHLNAGYKKLPLVIPVLFYNGKRRPYPFSTRWFDAFDDPPLAARLYNSDFPLVDITTLSDAEIMSHRSMAALTLLQKYIHRPELVDQMGNLSKLLLTENITGQQLVSLINYLLQSGEIPDGKAFVHGLAQRVPQHKDELMTIAEQFKQEGRDEGRLEGILEGKLEVALSMLQNGVDRDYVMRMTGLAEDQLAKTVH